MEAIADLEFTAWIDEARTHGFGPNEIGGKAAGLAALAAAGLPVPAAFVILPEAFVPGANVGARPTMAPGAAARIGEAYRRLSGGIPDLAVAVRSSASVEDGVAASHAGQFRTILDVRGEADVVEAALACAESLHAVAAEAYRAASGSAGAAAARMAVVVQRLVVPDAAGVAFTIDPISGDRQVVTINAAAGLGTSVVDGTTAPDRAWVDRATLTVTREAPANGGGMSIRASTSVAVARLALAAEAAVGGPADVEWAARDGAVWLLQARPVTGIPAPDPPETSREPRGPMPDFPFEWPDPADATLHWRRDGRPRDGIPTPWDEIEGSSFARAGRASAATLGRDQARRVVAFNGTRYSTDTPDPVPAHVREAQRLAFDAAIRAIQATDRTYWEAILEPEILAGNQRLDVVRPEGLDGASLATYFDDVLAWHERLWVLHLHLLHTVRFGPHTFRRQLENLLTESGVNAGDEIDRILSHVPTLTSASIEALADLARLVQAAPEHAAEMLAWPPTGASAPSDEVAAFRRGFDSLLSAYSLRADAGAFTIGRACQPGWRDRPDLPLALIARYGSQDLDAMATRKVEAVRDRDDAVARLRDGLRDDATRVTFDRLVAMARREVAAYENHNHAIDAAASALLWRARDAVGKALHAKGTLSDPSDVIWLTRAEIDGALRADAETVSRLPWPDLVTGRRAAHRWQSALAAPDWLGVPAPRDATPPIGVPAAGAPVPALATPPVDALVTGQPGSRGNATGRVRHVPPDAEVPEVEPGDVLVARNAGALWSPVMPLAAAVILEEGAQLQHAMLICREFAVPGIVQAKGALAALREGALVAVDGTHGWVVPVEAGDSAA